MFFDQQFFQEHLSKHVTEKAKHSRTGSATVKVRLSTGDTFDIAAVTEVYAGYVVFEVYPHDHQPKKNDQEERDLGAPQFDLDLLTVPYHGIVDVRITTDAPKNRHLGFKART